jgi:putative transposase
VGAFLNRTIEGDWPYLWIDATYVKTREAGRIVSVAVIVAVGVNTDGQREVLGLKVGASEAEPFWTEFLRSLNRRGLRGVKLVISDSHEGIKAAASKVLEATWQRCRVHFMRNALAHAGKTQRRMVSAAIGTVFVQDSADAARTQWRSVADQLRGKFPKLGSLMDEAENDVLAFMTWVHIEAILRRLGCPLWLAEHPCISAFSGLWSYTTGWDTTELGLLSGPSGHPGAVRRAVAAPDSIPDAKPAKA